MAVSYVWPGSLPQKVRTDYSKSRGTLIIRTPTDKGPAKMRRRGARPNLLAVQFHMTDAQLATLETFVFTTLAGTARFGFPDPRTGSQIEARIVPDGDGKLYTEAFVAPQLWLVSLQLEELP
jgi:hypothetical protein